MIVVLLCIIVSRLLTLHVFLSDFSLIYCTREKLGGGSNFGKFGE